MSKPFLLHLSGWFLYASIFLTPPLVLWYVIATHGSPHLIYHYTFYDNGNAYDPFRPRTYISCTYIGLSGSLTVLADQGRCPWLRFFKRENG